MSKETKFKVGDRVSVYGKAFDGTHCEGYYGTVDSVFNGWLTVRCDDKLNSTRADKVHPKQCRRLVKKPRRMCSLQWNQTDYCWDLETSPEKARHPGERVVFVEVRPKHEEKSESEGVGIGEEMPGVDRECEGIGATHSHACKCRKCREEYFKLVEAERDKWKEEYENACKFAIDYERQRDELRAEVSSLRSENERLISLRTQDIDSLHKAQEEVERLQEALQSMRHRERYYEEKHARYGELLSLNNPSAARTIDDVVSASAELREALAAVSSQLTALRREIDDAPWVYGYVDAHENATSGKFLLNAGFIEKQTHRAKLVRIEALATKGAKP